MNIGDKLYQVNRDDRVHGVDEHNFLTHECQGLFKINEFVTLKLFGRAVDTANSPRRTYEDMLREGDKTYIMFSYPNQTIVTTRNTMKELLEDLSLQSGANYYSDKVDASDEIASLLTHELENMKSKRVDMDEVINRMTETLKELNKK